MAFWRRRPRLAEPNVPEDWAERGIWCDWEAPRNYVAGEASYLDALAALVGPTCERWYCRPVVVSFSRERDNPYDSNAFRAEVNGVHVGYLRRHVAEQLAGPLDHAGCRTFAVCGLARGGSFDAPNLGCHVWLGRRVTAGPAIQFDADEYIVSWPPTERERELLGLG